MIRRVAGRAWAAVRSLWQAPGPADGFGQTLAQDAVYQARFWQCRRRAVAWRAPTPDERQAYDSHAIVGRFGDDTIAVARVDTRDWIVRDRVWHGWPDPPEFVFFALEGEAIWAAADFDGWPRGWLREGVG